MKTFKEHLQLTETISVANQIDHFKNRIKLAARLCDKVGNHPLIFRAFKHNKKDALLVKVDNSDTMFAGIKGGIGKRGQDAILTHLNIKKPTFTTMTPPDNVYSFFGRSFIFIPVGDVIPHWSPKVEDLGGQKIIGSDEERHIMNNNSGAMLDAAEKWAETYKHTWPNQYMKNELIFDCEVYYLLELEQFFSKFAGREHKTSLAPKAKFDTFRKIQDDAFKKIKTYSDLSWFLKNTALEYIDWFENVLPKKKAAEAAEAAERERIRKEAEDAWYKERQNKKS